MVRPSRTRRRIMVAASLATTVLACSLLAAPGPGPRLAAVACLLGTAVALASCGRDPAPAGAASRALSAGGAAGASCAVRAEFIGRGRIVVCTPAGRAVIWRDATDPQSFRRLAVRARWQRAAAALDRDTGRR